MAGDLSYWEAHRLTTDMLSAPLWCGLLLTFGRGSVFEVSTVGTGYGRKRVDTLFSPPDSAGRAGLISPIEFDEPTDLWGTIIAYGLFTAEIAGNRRRQKLLPTQRFVDVGSPRFVLAAGSISLDFT